MLANWLRAGFTARHVTTKYPRNGDKLWATHRWYTTVTMKSDSDVASCSQSCDCAALCPTGAIRFSDVTEKSMQLDVGACIGCGWCVEHCPERFAWTHAIDAVATDRGALVESKVGGERAHDQ